MVERTKILFIGEAVTLSHFARPAVLAGNVAEIAGGRLRSQGRIFGARGQAHGRVSSLDGGG